MRHSSGFLLAFACLFTFEGCAFFSGKPPLPRHAAIEQLGREASSADFAAAVERADVIYFPEDRAASAGRSEPAALLLEAFGQSRKPFAIGWDLIDATQQTELDELQSRSREAREAAIARVELVGTGQAREHCRSVLREARFHRVRHLALRCPPALVAKISTAERLTPVEEQFFPRGFSSPPGGMERYAQGLAAGREPGIASPAASYQTEMLRQQFAAEMIVRHFRSARPETRLLAFLSEADLEPGRGVPFYVAQKQQLRQLVFGREAPQGRETLLARAASSGSPGLEIVDGAPRPGRN